jgi:hypothetical protein
MFFEINELPDLTGRTIKRAVHHVCDSGYPSVIFELDDGTFFTVEETGQCGSIAYSRTPETTIRYPRGYNAELHKV